MAITVLGVTQPTRYHVTDYREPRGLLPNVSHRLVSVEVACPNPLNSLRATHPPPETAHASPEGSYHGSGLGLLGVPRGHVARPPVLPASQGMGCMGIQKQALPDTASSGFDQIDFGSISNG